MAIKTTRFTLDHCGCSITYEWDDTVPQDARVHTVVKIENPCRHQTAAPSGLFEDNICMRANAHKNFVLDEIASSVARLVVNRVQNDGTIARHFDEASAPRWGFDVNYVLHVVSDLSPQEKALVIANLRKSTHGLRKSAADRVVFD